MSLKKKLLKILAEDQEKNNNKNNESEDLSEQEEDLYDPKTWPDHIADELLELTAIFGIEWEDVISTLETGWANGTIRSINTPYMEKEIRDLHKDKATVEDTIVDYDFWMEDLEEELFKQFGPEEPESESDEDEDNK